MSTLILYSSKNSHGRKDATGAFIPEAQNFGDTHGVPLHRRVALNLSVRNYSKRRQMTLDAIEAVPILEPLDCIAFFGHGWPNGLQFGFTRKEIPALVEVLINRCNLSARIVLYACLAAENDDRDLMHGNVGPGTDGGFADMLRDEMVRQGFEWGWVDAHKTAGHTTWNPFLVRFLHESVTDITAGGIGGAWLVAPRSQYWTAWKEALRDKVGGLRYRFPFMTEIEIKAELAGIPLSSVPS
ncbi:MAG: hypothetical protein GWM98_04615 [Nitrospinaceae bacterium]|nr:hypothetical protein [Deltaproteobacteria bacterium]NIY14202.1 hypothetical protein [Nitrospinaceae bacterium]